MSERRRRISTERQINALVPLIGVWSIGGIALGIAGMQSRVPLSELLLDPNAVLGVPWYLGLLSNIGILAWTVAAAAAIGGAWVAKQTNRSSAARFLGVAGAVASILLLDDLLLLHSSVLPKLIGVPKSAATIIVVLPAVAWFAIFLGEILRTRWIILAAALSSFFVSIAADQILSPEGSTALLFEDGAKFLGILAWSLYFVLTTHDIVRSTIQEALANAVRSSDPDRQDDGDNERDRRAIDAVV